MNVMSYLFYSKIICSQIIEYIDSINNYIVGVIVKVIRHNNTVPYVCHSTF